MSGGTWKSCMGRGHWDIDASATISASQWFGYSNGRLIPLYYSTSKLVSELFFIACYFSDKLQFGSGGHPKMYWLGVFFSPLFDRNYQGGLRSRDTMEAQGAFVKPDYVPPRGSRFRCFKGISHLSRSFRQTYVPPRGSSFISFKEISYMHLLRSFCQTRLCPASRK